MIEVYGAYGAEEPHSRLTTIVLYQVVEYLGHFHTVLSFNDWHNTKAYWEQTIDQH